MYDLSPTTGRYHGQSKTLTPIITRTDGHRVHLRFVLPDCEQHISPVYAQLGSPAVDTHSFWTVYNTLRKAVDSDLLSSCTVDDPEGKNASEGGADIVRLPPSFLCKWSPSHPDCTARR